MLSAVRFDVVTALIVCVPVRYLPDEIVWSDVEGWIVCAACVVTDAVRETDELPAVPDETHTGSVRRADSPR